MKDKNIVVISQGTCNKHRVKGIGNVLQLCAHVLNQGGRHQLFCETIVKTSVSSPKETLDSYTKQKGLQKSILHMWWVRFLPFECNDRLYKPRQVLRNSKFVLP